MKITAIRDIVVPISYSIRNAYIDFSTLIASVVAVYNDVVRDGRPVVGFGFNSNGRYAQQALPRERFIPRLLAAASDPIVDERGLIFAPFGGFAHNSPVIGSRVGLPDVPGIGFEAKSSLYAVLKPLAADAASST